MFSRQSSLYHKALHQRLNSIKLLSMPPKRKVSSLSSSNIPPASKKLQTIATNHDYDEGVVNKKYYPPVLSNARCKDYIEGRRLKPIEELESALFSISDFRTEVSQGSAVVHWFRTDLRIIDNTALYYASQLAKAVENDCAVIGLFLLTPEDLEAFSFSPARVDFILRSLQVVQKDLADKGIPLWIETVDKRGDVPGKVIELCKRWNAKHLYANMEYEVDELRRDAKVVRLGEKNGVSVSVLHDTCVVAPGVLLTKSTNKPFSVYSPWYRAWVAHLNQNQDLLDTHPAPDPNPPSAKDLYADLFASAIPNTPASHTLTTTESKTVQELFPAGSDEALTRLTRFLTSKGAAYSNDRNFPSKPGTSVLSPHFASGTLSARTAVAHAKALNNSKLIGGNKGLDVWISEVAWRDFYRHVLVAFPHICMNKAFKPEYNSIIWCEPSLAVDRLAAWKAGRTGFPIVDAAMRHLAAQKWMPNRLRMVTASFLAKDLHVDWRLGEQYFHATLIDGDFASNSGGWGFSSSAGVDPQPYFRVFNPERQSETFDKDGEYIRTWIKELQGIKGKEIHCPSPVTRKQTGYPKKIVEHDVQRKLALEIYKEGIERGKTL